ncbi:glycoside hydrolase family 99-like domain-containing protein [Paenibacillus sp.]|uniref:glycosyltransferase WbsX family protein n=1 Tax=Paenibacillus sp. TaxID=58172 RepID=UPI002D46F537|nr:glycoside hydrolase family 99-like domain-containing protein [Paenibacillus sp.]HZG56188.1 glycoside hydrolase family 99-like domain-containing protein [Paenibacillus sp.]
MNQPYEVAVYYFPQWHPDPQNEEIRGAGWSEWVSLREAKPRFPGHQQPKVPLWGELDESDPEVSRKQIDAAADHGVTTFLYDWYWDLGKVRQGPFLHRALEEGYLQAPNRERLKFALMWANHNELSRERFEAMIDYIVEKYFHAPNYLTVDGKLYFSIYEMYTFVRGLGGIEEAADALESFRRKAERAGYAGLHLNAVEWGLQEQHRAILGDDVQALISRLGVDSVTSYVWIHHAEPEAFPGADYAACAEDAIGLWPVFRDKFGVPYHPNVTMGWDPSPRTDQGKPLERGEYPYTPILTENTPEAFEKALRRAKAYLDEGNTTPPMVTIYAWNEWTEGGYLEPDTVYGMGYLEAIRNVFGARK